MYVVAINICGVSECRNLFRSPQRTLKAANKKFERLLSGEENYGQFLFDPHEVGVMLSITSLKGVRIRTMQIN